MKRIAVIVTLVVCTVLGVYAQKDITAWKNEKGMEQQYEVFKTNLNFWNGSYFMKPAQLEEYYGALKDSVEALEKLNENSKSQILTLNNELRQSQARVQEIQSKLDESIKNQDSITVFGMLVHKSTYAFVLYSIIIGLLVVAGFVFLLFKRSNKITTQCKKDFNELKEEYESHKKNALDRYTKINMELHKTRLELNKR